MTVAGTSELSGDDRALLERALGVAEHNAARGQRPFGAVVALGGRIVGEGANTVLAGGDPTEHAEMQAMRLACLAIGAEHLAGGIVYSSAEPCAMCQATGVQLGIERMIFAAGLARAAEAGFPAPQRAVALKSAWHDVEPEYAVSGTGVVSGVNRPFEIWHQRNSRPPEPASG